jgi:hypothetical protein
MATGKIQVDKAPELEGLTARIRHSYPFKDLKELF